ncbi:MAG: sulfate ABC transporter substrate-binding protein, partial [Selenomonadaceae bacterium]|nr:sulfate ABC transporter substrate-binding protein [Selenomonadaceae bacterium]
MKMKKVFSLALGVLFAAGVMAGCGTEEKAATENGSAKEFLNVSYDPTRELYAEFNKEFTK